MSAPARPCRRSRQSKPRSRQRTNGPSLEALEDRCLLSAGFNQINLDSDVAGLARVTDPNLVNPWGIAFSPTGAFWFGDNNAWVSDVVDGNGKLLPVVVAIPGAGGNFGEPTGTVYNGGPGFQITENGVSGSAHFLFASEDGTISAWNPHVDDANALVTIDNSTAGADYKGLATATGSDGKTYLYAADFGRGEIDVFDQNFQPVSTAGAFADPNLPQGFAPFNVQNINGQLFVTYAKQASGGYEAAPGAGNGFVDVFSPSGNLVQRFASGGPLNSPWGLAVAPSSFGAFAGDLLIGNNGDGHISAYDRTSGAYLGQLSDGSGNPIAISGLWGLTVGNDHLAGNSQTLFFAAGIDDGQHGLFGAIQNSQAGQTSTAGTLSYDPNSDDEDYPIPPAHGPSLGTDAAQPGPTAVLLPSSNSTFALAPTLSNGTQQPDNQFSLFLTPALTAASINGARDAGISITAPWSIAGTGGVTAFSLTSPLERSASNAPTESSTLLSINEDNPVSSVPLMLLDQHPTADALEADQDASLVASSRLPLLVPHVFAEQIPTLSSQEPRLENKSEQSIQEQPASLVAEPDALGRTFWLRSLFFAVASCLPWNQYGVGTSQERGSRARKEIGKNRLSL